MATQIRTTQKQVQTLTLTPQQRQSLHILQLNLPELRAELYQEMSQNPVIEDIESTLERQTTSQIERAVEEHEREFDSDYTEDDDIPETVYTADADALDRKQKFIETQTTEESLEEHLLSQLPSSNIEEADYPLAELLIGELDADGFFRGSLPDLMMVTGESEAKIRATLALLTELDPLGCGAMSLEQCLLAQLDKLEGSPYQQEVREILERGHLKHIAEGQQALVEKDLGMSAERYADVLEALRTLEPRPGRAYTRQGKSVAYVNPEVHAVKVGTKWMAQVDSRSLPEIHVSEQYLKMMKDPQTAPETRAYLQKHIEAVAEIQEAVEHREETIESIAQAILDAQPAFFEQGLKGLKPLTMQEVAEKVGVHHTTVSRTVRDKYISTPKGTVELRQFFTQGQTSVLERLKAIVDAEDKAHPLSDDKISELLKAEGFSVARRTVAKYRQILNIPGAGQRGRSHVLEFTLLRDNFDIISARRGRCPAK